MLIGNAMLVSLVLKEVINQVIYQVIYQNWNLYAVLLLLFMVLCYL